MAYAWLTFGQAKAELALRLNDPNGIFWSNAENGLLIAWSMRLFSALTAFWVAEYPVAITTPLAGNWLVANGAASPRQPTLTDTDLYTMMQYFLLEPPTGGVWSGTNQFNASKLAQAVQGRRDEALQIGATSVVEIKLASTPGTNRIDLPDNVLDVWRVRYIPDDPLGDRAALQRGDAESFRVFTPNYVQTSTPPMRWDVISGPPLSLTLDSNIPVPATFEVLVMQAGVIPNPPTPTALGLPDDWTWVVMFGALADLLSAQEESRDVRRAEYARKRYLEGLQLLKNAVWLLEARVNNVPVDTPSVIAADRFSYSWQTRATAFPGAVVGAMDLYTISPIPTSDTSVLLTMVANAPIPTNDAAFIQVPRDVMDAILDEAEHLATFKRGSADLMASLNLHESFLGTVGRWNSRIREAGIFSSTLRSNTPRGETQQPRFAMPGKEK